LLAAALTAQAAQPAPQAEVGLGQVLPDRVMDGLNGPARHLDSYRGRPLIINVWASWCGPCRAETASLERLAWRDAARGIVVIGISTDDERERALAWLRQSNATYNHYIDHHLVLEHLLGARQLPLTVLVDAQGRVRARIVGSQDWDSPQARALIERSIGAGRHGLASRGP
ncbi:MAG: TlpA family protein disulfide reductase, partial [Burkholderiales bacterium]|nr:TlpA family protein disulfide reductase [Burkholderiales bacterium]